MVQATHLHATHAPSGEGLSLLGRCTSMQTFLPYASFTRSAAVLDRARLGKQRVEVVQIIKALTIPNYPWFHHPAVLMWKGHEEALVRYGLTMSQEWVARGFEDTCADLYAPLAGLTLVRTEDQLAEDGALPDWLGDVDFHRAHQSSLLRKEPEHYLTFFGDVPDDLPYVWPRRAPAVLERERRKRERAERAAQAPRAASLLAS